MHLYVAPAASGKTAYLVELARRLSRDLQATPRVVVSTRLQVRAWRQRLAAAGGALGVRVGTFDTLYRDILTEAGETYALIGDAVQFRIARQVVVEASLVHYASLQRMPGFVQVVLRLIRELKAAGIQPEALAGALTQGLNAPRLRELADLYLAYQSTLQAHGWADYPGMGWLAAEALAAHPEVGQGWSPLLVDGFDDLSTVQLQILTLLSGRTQDLFVTLTGTLEGARRDPVHRRFIRTRDRLEAALDVRATALPATLPAGTRAEALAHLEASFLHGMPVQVPAGDAVAMVAAPDRPGEVREALRWLKARLVWDGLRLREVALLARKVGPYRNFIVQIAREFGLPIQLVEGYPLRGNPAVAALMSLLRLTLPGGDHFAWRPVVAAWRSPYFAWHLPDPDEAAAPGLGRTPEQVRITPEDAALLDRVARWASVVGGLDQWDEAFALLADAGEVENVEDGERGLRADSGLPTGERAARLHRTFRAFVRRVTPPEGPAACHVFVAWLEALIGGFDEVEAPAAVDPEAPSELGLARSIQTGPADLRERDTAALNALKDVLRGLVWADEAVACAPVDFRQFFADLQGAVDVAVYHPPLSAREDAVLVVSVADARGLSFRAAAVLGLAEGEFPAAISEDPLLRDRDRRRLRDDHGLALDLSADSAEAAYFYEAITRATTSLLLTRPRVADNGAAWQASPYWDDVASRLAVEPVELASGSHTEVARGASWAEVMVAAADLWEDMPAVRRWLLEAQPARCTALTAATDVLYQRTASRHAGPSLLGTAPSLLGTDTPYDGGLQAWAQTFATRYSAARSWSASRLESYALCPFSFFVGHTLGLEPRQPPTEGLDARQLGNIYHHIFEEVYRAVADPARADSGRDLPALLAALPVAAETVLAEAPRREQFRPTAWWAQTRAEIVENIRRSLEMLEEARGDYVPIAYEAAFGLDGYPARADSGSGRADSGPPLVVAEGDDCFTLRGLIDRVDRSPSGNVRVIDYKTAGRAKFTARAVRDGKKLQLPLYALAAQQALGLGPVIDGFYWHVRQAEPSSLTLARYDGGAEGAIAAAVAHAWAAVRRARAGAFLPTPPEEGCPGYCAASGFCWHYSPGW